MGGCYIHNARQNVWETDIEVIENCSKAPKNIVIQFKPNVKKKIDILMSKYQSREWLAYLLGKDYIVEDIYFPKQRATGGSVDNIEFPSDIGQKVIGVIHSHHSMGAVFSETDNEYINGNHDISIVVSHTSVKGTIRWNTPCGSKKLIPAKVKIFLDIDFNEKEFENDVEEKMKVEVNTVDPMEEFTNSQEDSMLLYQHYLNKQLSLKEMLEKDIN